MRELIAVVSILPGLLAGPACSDGGDAAKIPLVAYDDQAATVEGASVVVPVLDNDQMPEGAILQLAWVDEPAHGSATATADGQIEYVPAPRFDGVESFYYGVTTDAGEQDEAQVTVTITGKNDPPEAADDLLGVVEGATWTLPVLDNDGDPEARPLTLRIVTPPEHGGAEVTGTGGLAYAPEPGHNGADALTYAIEDDGGLTAQATAYVTTYESLPVPAAAESPDETPTAIPAPQVRLPRVALTAAELGVVVNAQDPQSVAVADYYVAARGIPEANVITLSFAPPGPVMSREDFAEQWAAFEAAVPPAVQALALTWTEPYRVDCMSVTSAFAFGFDTRYCKTEGASCGPTASAPSYAAETLKPWDDLGYRPTMALAGERFEDVIALIDRGVASDDTFPGGEGWMFRTTDEARSVRWPWMVDALDDWPDPPGALSLTYVDNSDGAGSDYLESANGVLFYFTGLAIVQGVETLDWRPGAIADHLTSFGGKLTDSIQMSVLRWLESGATGSYGTVVEPCNYPAKFPHPRLVMRRYFRGRTLIEAYWASVKTPGEGIFVGEPLARPWGRDFLAWDGSALTIRTTHLSEERSYAVRGAGTADGFYDTALLDVDIPCLSMSTLSVPAPIPAFYELVERSPEE